jgi:aminoglycoside phosphotransferase (APT) family kinase protein
VPDLALAEPLAPLPGGFDTQVLAFRLRGAPGAFAGPLVLRLLGPRHDPRRVLRECAVQRAVAAQGFPAPPCLLADADPAPLGAPFLLMTRLPGRPLLRVRGLGLGATLAETQARLHALDPAPLLAAVAAAGLDPASLGFDGYLERLAARVAAGPLEGLRPVLDWLRARRPAAAGAPVICHGDFHPQNLLAEGRRVTGVVDWPNCLVADPAFDVASTRVILALTPLDMIGVPVPLRWAVGGARRALLAAYQAAWRRRGLADPARLAYHEVAAALRLMVVAAEGRAGVGGAAPGPLEASRFPDELAAHTARVTGLPVRLPPAP